VTVSVAETSIVLLSYYESSVFSSSRLQGLPEVFSLKIYCTCTCDILAMVSVCTQSVQCTLYVLYTDIRFCESCKCIKPDRAHHCSSCRRSVLKSTVNVNLNLFEFDSDKGIQLVLTHSSASEPQEMFFSIASHFSLQNVLW